MRNVLLFLHILGAGTWIGGNVFQVLVAPKMRATGGAVAASWYRTTVRLGRVMYTPAAVLILVTGVFLVLDHAVYEFETVFVVIGFLAVIAGGALGGTVFGPQGRRVAQLFESGEDPSEAEQASSRITAFGLLDTVIILVALASMVSKWGI